MKYTFSKWNHIKISLGAAFCVLLLMCRLLFAVPHRVSCLLHCISVKGTLHCRVLCVHVCSVAEWITLEH